MIATVALGCLLISATSATAQGYNCWFGYDAWGVDGDGFIRGYGMTTVRGPNQERVGNECVERLKVRAEVWIWGLPLPRLCPTGWYDEARGSCVNESKPDTVAQESRNRYGLWDGASRHWAIDLWLDGNPWTYITDDFFLVSGGVKKDPDEEPPSNTPVVIPLTNAQTFKLTSVADGVVFDLDADGAPEQTAWTAPDSQLAFLAYDRNNNGFIDDGSELFGGRTIAGAPNGFAALAKVLESLGGVKAGAVRAGDPLYDKLLLWEDANHNGFSEPGELRPAKEFLTQIGMGYGDHDRRDGYGNLFRFKGWAELRTAGPGQGRASTIRESEARRRDIYDVLFAR